MPERFEQDVVERDHAEAEKPGACQREGDDIATRNVATDYPQEQTDQQRRSERPGDEDQEKCRGDDDRVDQRGDEARTDASDGVGDVDLLRRLEAITVVELK